MASFFAYELTQNLLAASLNVRRTQTSLQAADRIVA